MNNAPTQTGVIKRYNFTKGYGFIRPDATSGPDIFFHINSLRGAHEKGFEPREGNRVSYTSGMDRNQRPCAENVRVQLES